ncbi:MAG: phage GP46 family protein [Gallionella sp.]|nr:phage GP46 family protein [Gallionella sp.]
MTTYLDPATADYSLIGGLLAKDPAGGLANAIYLRLVTPLGCWWADKTLGSRLHELEREKDVSRVGILARQFVEMALRPLIDDGRVKSMTTSVQQPHNGRALLSVEVIASTGAKVVFNQFMKVA